AGGGICIDGAHVGAIAVELSPLTTAPVTRSAASGVFCYGQESPGCFGKSECRSITENGLAAGRIGDGATDVALASVFCIPSTENGLINAVASLPGPGAISLAGTFTVEPLE